MTRTRHTDAVERGLLRSLLGQTIVGLGQVVLGDPTNALSSSGGISAMLSLVFTLQDVRQFELDKNNASVANLAWEVVDCSTPERGA